MHRKRLARRPLRHLVSQCRTLQHLTRHPTSLRAVPRRTVPRRPVRRSRARRLRGGVAVAMLATTVAVSGAGAAGLPLPTPAGLVSDFANAIDAATVRALTARLSELRRKTGADIAVVTVRTTAPETAFDYAMRLAEAWKPGAPGKDNGVVFLVAVADRELFIATGYGIEGALPDGLVGEIRDRDIVPRFRTGDLPGGIRAGVERMAAIIAREYGVELSPATAVPEARRRNPSGAGIDPFVVTMILIFFFVVLPMLAAAFGDPRRRRGGMWSAGPMWGGGFGGGGFGGPGGGFGGFGGGGFGGGGVGGKW